MITDFGVNVTGGKDYVVGDIHGCYSLLTFALEQLNFNYKKDRLISLGDIIDRGPESHLCIKLLEKPWFKAISGNHESMFCNLENDLYTFLANGGEWIYEHDHEGFNSQQEWYEHYKKITQTLPRAATVKTPQGFSFGLIHAEYLGAEWNKIDLNAASLIWGRNRIRSKNTSKVSGVDHIFCGHTPVDEPITLGNTTYLDTCAFYDGKLSIADLSKFIPDTPTDCITTFIQHSNAAGTESIACDVSEEMPSIFNIEILTPIAI